MQLCLLEYARCSPHHRLFKHSIVELGGNPTCLQDFVYVVLRKEYKMSWKLTLIGIALGFVMLIGLYAVNPNTPSWAASLFFLGYFNMFAHITRSH